MTRSERFLDEAGRLLRRLRDGLHFIVREVKDEWRFFQLCREEDARHRALYA